MPALGCIAAVLMAPTPGPWFGLGRVSFSLPPVQNPYDGEANDVRVVFEGPGGRQERMAFFDGAQWKAVLASPHRGRYRASVTVNGRKVKAALQPATVSLESPLPGYVRLAPGRRFALDGGAPFWPIGANLGWNSPPQTVEKTLAEYGRQGMNWARIWACAWDGKNPYWLPGAKDPGLMDPAVLNRWDGIVQAAEKAGVRFQFVLFHHGLFSRRVNSNWRDHPWNKAAGGFLGNPADFFSDPLCRKLARNWLRYAVARWGHSPSIMAWELFNEVEWVDAKYDGRIMEIAAWHKDMAERLRKIDPARHLTTSSSDLSLPVFSAMDYYQPHGYPPSVESMVLSASLPKDKPCFYGEVGTGSYHPGEERSVVRDAAWSGFFAGHAGASQYWFWDRLEQQKLYGEIGQAARFILKSGLAWDRSARPVSVDVKAPFGEALVLHPGLGWTASKSTTLRVPEDALTGQGLISSYLQGKNNRRMFPKPLTISLSAPAAGEASFVFGPVSRNGAKVVIRVNGREAALMEQPAGPQDRGRMVLTVPFAAGRSVIEAANEGDDWAVLQSMTFSGLAKTARALGFGSPRKIMLRIRSSRPGEAIGLERLGLADGRARVEVLNLDSGAVRTASVAVKGGSASWKPGGADEALLISR